MAEVAENNRSKIHSNVTPRDVDVLVIGAGIAGLGFAWHIRNAHPDRSVTILEARDRMGGTWDFFKYPGLRSDVDMHLYGFSFAPFTDWGDAEHNTVARADTILDYVHRTAKTEGLDRLITYNTRVRALDWDSQTARWSVTCDTAEGEVIYSANWVQTCWGYYSYKRGYTPDFAGRDDFSGEIIHPQDWTEDTSVAGRRVVMIGSGATAVTIAPELAKSAAHLTLLQRSPSYVFAGPSRDKWAELARVLLPARAAYALIRKRNLFLDRMRYRISTQNPEKMKRMISEAANDHLPEDFDRTHLTPRYGPDEQRVCFAPGGDFHRTLARDDVEIVTDSIDCFDADGIVLASGRHIPTDTVVTATGLNMTLGEDVEIAVDGARVDLGRTWLYKGAMVSGVPNLALTVGTLVSPYTLKVEMIGRWVARILARMDRDGSRTARPTLPVPADDMPVRPFTTEFSSGYLMRVQDRFPKQGAGPPWDNAQSYDANVAQYKAPIDDGHLRFS